MTGTDHDHGENGDFAGEIMEQGQVVYKRPDALTENITQLLPGLHARHHPPPDRRGDRRAGHQRADDPGRAGRLLGADVQLLQRRCGRGRARPRAGDGDRLKRTQPDKIVFTYQGDGDLASIGAAEILHAANRGENITRLLRQQRGLRHDQRADGADHADRPGDDLVARWAATRSCTATRCAWPRSSPGCRARPTSSGARCYDTKTIRQAKKAVVTAFKAQLAGLGLSMVEFLSSCPTNWHMSPPDCADLDSRHDGPVLPAGRLQGDGRGEGVG